MQIINLDENNIVLNGIDIPDTPVEDLPSVVDSLGLTGTWIPNNSSEPVSIGQEYSVEQGRFKPINYRETFVFDETLWKWVPPVPAPADATWATDLEEKPEGHDDLAVKKVYFWVDEFQAWGLASCGCFPPPDDGQTYGWNYLTYQWELALDPSPGEGYVWNPVYQEWMLVPDSHV